MLSLRIRGALALRRHSALSTSHSLRVALSDPLAANSLMPHQRCTTDAHNASRYFSTGRDVDAAEDDHGKEQEPENDRPKPTEATTPSDAPLPAADQGPTLEDQIADLSDRLRRCQADRENTIRISRRDVADATDKGVVSFAKEFLDVADNLRRAVDSVPAEHKESAGVKPLLEGVEMTEHILQSTFEKFSIRMINPQGEKFDPNLHNALFEMPHPEMEDGVVGMVQQAGYVLKERILRPAAVGVVRNPPAESS